MFSWHDGGCHPHLQMTLLGSEKLSNLPRVVPVTHLNKSLSCFRAHTISTGCFLQVVGPGSLPDKVCYMKTSLI